MSKSTVIRMFVGGLIGAGAGMILTIGAIGIAIASSVLVLDGTHVVSFQNSPYAWSLAAFALVGAVAMAGGAITGLVAWIGALLNTWAVESKAWFVGLLLLGIFNLGFLAMIAYVVAGPDGKRNAALVAPPAPLPA